MGYSIWQPAISPGFLRGPFGAAWAQALGQVKDYLSSIAKQGIQQRFAGLAQAGGISALGAERGIPQGASEPTETYVGTIINAWNEWELAGTPWSILGLLSFLGYANAYLVTQDGQVWGPASSAVIPNPTLGIVGTPPTLAAGTPPWTFAIGSGPAGLQGFQFPTDGYWEPSTSYTNATISPNPPNGLLYSMTGTHTSGSSAPAWPGTIGATVVDGGITWTCLEPADLSPVGQTQGYVNPDFWSAFLIVITPIPSSWTDVLNPPTVSSSPSRYELDAIYALLTNFNAAHASCGGILITPTSATRATFGWPTPRTFYGDVGETAPSASADGLTKFWIPHAAVVHNQQCIPTTPNGYWYRATQGGSGTSSYTQPVWPVIIGNTVSDGSVTWTCEGTANDYLTGTSSEVTTFAFVPTTLE